MPNIFISYSRSDSTFVEELVRLISHAYSDVWYDQKLKGGKQWWEEILRNIDNCDCFIFLITTESLTSEYCQKELVRAQELGKWILPINRDASVPLPADLQKIQYVSMEGPLPTSDSISSLYAALIQAAPFEKPEEWHSHDWTEHRTTRTVLDLKDNELKVLCSRCNSKTLHKVLYATQITHEILEVGEAPWERGFKNNGYQIYEIIQCKGCRGLSFRLETYDPEYVTYVYDADGNDYADSDGVKEEVFPAPDDH